MVFDGVKRVFGGGSGEVPIPAPNNPEYAPMYAAMEAEDMTGTVGVALDNSSLIIQIEAYLSGKQLVQTKDEKTGRQHFDWKQVGEAKMNDRGVKAVLLQIRSLLDKNAIMTYFPNYDELNKFMMHFSINITEFIGQNAESFEIKEGYMSATCDFIVDNVLITLQRGLEGNEKQGVYKQSRRIENYTIPLNSPANMQGGRGGLFK